MSEVMTLVPQDGPLMRAWEAYRRTESYANTRRWAIHSDHVDGSLWAAFQTGFNAAAADAQGARIAELEAEVEGLQMLLSSTPDSSG